MSVNTFKGETGSGKSRLINLILREELLPHSVLSNTSTICELKYGEQRSIVAHFKDKDPETGLPTKECPLENASSEESYLQQISPFVHVEGDREKGSVYKKIELFWPHQLLKVFITNVVVNIGEPSTPRGNGRWLGMKWEVLFRLGLLLS